jgi:hypothetical protein
VKCESLRKISKMNKKLNKKLKNFSKKKRKSSKNACTKSQSKLKRKRPDGKSSSSQVNRPRLRTLSSCDKTRLRRSTQSVIGTSNNNSVSVSGTNNHCSSSNPDSIRKERKINKLRRRTYKNIQGCKTVEGCCNVKNDDEIDNEEGGESAFGKWGNALKTGSSIGLDTNIDYESMVTREFYIDSNNIPIKGMDENYYHSFQQRKLAKFFISQLLTKLSYDEESMEKCLLAPTATFAKILDIIYRKIHYKSFNRLVHETDMNCPAINELPKRLKNVQTLEKIKRFFNNHVKRIEEK